MFKINYKNTRTTSMISLKYFGPFSSVSIVTLNKHINVSRVNREVYEIWGKISSKESNFGAEKQDKTKETFKMEWL